MAGSWRDLEVPYFDEEVCSALDHLMDTHGFDAEPESGPGMTYARDGQIIVLHYYPEDSPRFSPMVTVGAVVSDPDGPTTVGRMGLWNAIDSDNPLRSYESWRFSNRAELRAVLERIRDELIVPIALPLLSDRRRLEALLESHRQEVHSRYEELVQARELSEAQAAFERGDFRTALDLYLQLDQQSLSASDRKRVEIAKRRL